MKTINCVMMAAAFIPGCALDAPNGPEAQDGSADRTTETAVSDAKLVSTTIGGPGTLTPHCVGRVSSNEVSCYSTFREAIAFATGGAISDAPEARAALADESFARRINALSVAPRDGVVIGTMFVDANFQGASFTWTAGRACDGNASTLDYWVTSLVPVGWNDVISSFRSFSNCQTVLFEDVDFGGTSTPKEIDMSFVGGAMNDRASSIQWY